MDTDLPVPIAHLCNIAIQLYSSLADITLPFLQLYQTHTVTSTVLFLPTIISISYWYSVTYYDYVNVKQVQRQLPIAISLSYQYVTSL
jgi:P2-related tail formation protein